MSGQQVAYRRVSTTDQSTARQLDGMEFDRVFEDKLSGGTTDRPQLIECLAYLRQGDTLHVHSIDRAARNLADLLRIIEGLLSKGVAVKFHKENLIFTGEENPFQKLQLHIIGAVAEFERSLIRERQREGIAVAKRAGKHLGRKPSLSLEQRAEVREKKKAGARIADLAREFDVNRDTIYNALKEG